MHRVAVVDVVALFAMSGCSGLTESAEHAPGVSDERVVNATALATAHSDVLANVSYTFTRNYTQRIDADEYFYSIDHDTRVRVSSDGGYLYRHRSVVDTMTGSSRRLEAVWTNGTVAVMRAVDVDNDSVTYTRYQPPEPYSAADVTRSGISSALGAATVIETWNESGSRYARLSSNESETRRMQAGNDTIVNATTTRGATAIVRGDGFVPRAEWTCAGHRPLPAAVTPDAVAGHINDTRQIQYTDVGSMAVPRPDWVDDGLDATEDLPPGESSEAQSPTLRPSARLSIAARQDGRERRPAVPPARPRGGSGNRPDESTDQWTCPAACESP